MMDEQKFDDAVCNFYGDGTRRRVLGFLAGALAGITGATRWDAAAAKKKRKRKKKKKNQGGSGNGTGNDGSGGGEAVCSHPLRPCGNQCIPGFACCYDTDCVEGTACDQVDPISGHKICGNKTCPGPLPVCHEAPRCSSGVEECYCHTTISGHGFCTGDVRIEDSPCQTDVDCRVAGNGRNAACVLFDCGDGDVRKVCATPCNG